MPRTISCARALTSHSLDALALAAVAPDQHGRPAPPRNRAESARHRAAGHGREGRHQGQRMVKDLWQRVAREQQLSSTTRRHTAAMGGAQAQAERLATDERARSRWSGARESSRWPRGRRGISNECQRQRRDQPRPAVDDGADGSDRPVMKLGKLSRPWLPPPPPPLPACGTGRRRDEAAMMPEWGQNAARQPRARPGGAPSAVRQSARRDVAVEALADLKPGVRRRWRAATPVRCSVR